MDVLHLILEISQRVAEDTDVELVFRRLCIQGFVVGLVQVNVNSQMDDVTYTKIKFYLNILCLWSIYVVLT